MFKLNENCNWIKNGNIGKKADARLLLMDVEVYFVALKFII